MSTEINIEPASPNFQTKLAEQIANIAPEVVADGSIDVDKLADLLGKDTPRGKERFGLSWPGKREAQRIAQTPTTATLQPDRENSKNWDDTGNVFIEGDNLEVLKILQKHYYGKIKLIYIDPPYNTGNDFVYKDDYRDGVAQYLEWTDQVSESGKTSSNQETTGRYHSNWLNMMYPRLKLARNLLTDDGVIFISIDDHEQVRLKQICDEIFGENNFVSTFIIVRSEGGGLAKQAVIGHDYLLCYSRSISAFIPLGKPKDIRGSVVTIDGTEYWIETDWLRKEFGKYGTCLYEEILQFHSADKKDEIDRGLSDGIYTLVPKGNGHAVGRYRKVEDDTSKFYTILRHFDKDGTAKFLNKDGTLDLEQIEMKNLFEYPKPVNLIKTAIQGGTIKSRNDQDIILDFFGGSCSSAQATMELNAEDGGNRKFIMVQIPEPTTEKSTARIEGYENIAQISRKRIDLSGERVIKREREKLENSANNLDVGFRSYKLIDTNFAKWQVQADASEGELQDLFENLKDSADDDATPEALFTEVLLKLGFSLTEQYKTETINGLDVFSMADRSVIGYFNEHVTPTLNQLRSLVDACGWRLLILEDSFNGDDELKANLVQLCSSRGIELAIA